MERKTLLFYINSIHGGGAERTILQVASRFADAGYRSILVTSFVDKTFEYPIPNGVERISIEQKQIIQSRLKRNISRILALRKLCKQYKPQALISFMGEPNFRAILAACGLPTKNIVSVRSDPNKEYGGRLGYLVGKYILPRADGCVFQTEDAKAWFPQRLQKKSAVILNQVAAEFFCTSYLSGKNIVTLGRLDTVKNHAMLIRAFTSIANCFPDVNLDIYGEGKRYNDLQSLIGELGMESRIRLLGQTSEAASILSKAKMFVLSSNAEGMPNALMEALSVGVPSVSTDCPCGGPRALIRDGENGLLVPVGDEQALAQAMRRILDDETFAKQLSMNAKIGANNFRPDKVFSQWRSYVESVIGEAI